MTKDLIHICTDQDGTRSYYEQSPGKFGPGFIRCIRIPKADKEFTDPEVIKEMEEDQPE